MILDFIRKLLGINDNTLNYNKSIIKSKSQKSVPNINFSTPVFDLNGENVVHPELKEKQELDNLYDEIRVLQAKNREKIDKNKITYRIK